MLLGSKKCLATIKTITFSYIQHMKGNKITMLGSCTSKEEEIEFKRFIPGQKTVQRNLPKPGIFPIGKRIWPRPSKMMTAMW